MCGLFGAIGNGIGVNDLNVLRELGIVSQLRGLDGAGVFEVNTAWKNPKEILAKSDEDFNFLYFSHNTSKKAKNKILDSVMNNIIIGHVRAATVGVISEENCHPFSHGTIVGAHNGTLVDKKYRDTERTDSDLMFEDISKRGIEEVLNELDEKSAYAITMYDRASKKLIITRNDKRPFFFALNFKRNVLYWASERGLLELVLKRNGIDYEGYNKDPEDETKWIKYGGIHLLKERVVWIIDPANVSSKSAKIFGKGPEIKKKEEVKKEEVKKVDKGNVKDFPLIVTPLSNKNHPLETTCAFCDSKITLLDMYEIRGGLKGHYDQFNDNYYCGPCCDTSVEKSKSVG